MKSVLTAACLAAALLIACACSASVGTGGNTTNAAAANTAASNRAAAPAQTANAATHAAANNTNTAASSTSGGEAQEGGKQDFTLVNSTGVEIHKLYVSPHDKDDWEEDILGRDTLPPGQGVNIKFHRDETAAMWDLRVEDSQGNSIEWENLNLLQISKVTLHYENGRAWADTE